MKIENRQQFLIMLTAAVVALWLCDMIVFEPLGKEWSARSTQIRDLSLKVKDGNSLIKSEARLRGRWGDMRTNALAADPSLAGQQVIAAFDNWSRSSGAEVTSIMPQWKNDATNYMTFNCRVEANGTMSALSQFLYDIEKGPMALKLDSVELSSQKSDTGEQLTLGLQISGLALLLQK
jgi:Tfp pilus assembly protein PilO